MTRHTTPTAARQVGACTGPVPLMSLKDVGLLGLLPALTVVAWLVRSRVWPALTWWLAGLRMAVCRRRARQEVASLARVIGGRLGSRSAVAWRRAQLGHDYHAWLHLLRCYRPGGRPPSVRLDGRHHLEAALAAGKGGILWVAPFAFSDLATKVALDRAGYGVSHLSRDSHGFSTSRFGRRFLNPIQTRAEARHLAERLVMTETDGVGPLRTLARRLKAGRLVSITVTGTGRQTRDVPLLGGHIRIATGAPALAWQSGAALLPVFTVLCGDGLVTRIEAPLPRPAASSRAAAIEAMLWAYAPILEREVERAPDQLPLPYVALAGDDPLPSGRSARTMGAGPAEDQPRQP